MAKAEQLLMESLNLNSCLKERILCRVPPAPLSSNETSHRQEHGSGSCGKRSFVLYLPTVLLRKRHNPAFSFACRLANHHKVPLVVLVTILDDRHLSRTPPSPIAMTSRRLAFVLEALRDSCGSDWESHGAGVAIRVHAPGCRNPHHLSLAHGATAVVADEPFVEPYREYTRKVAGTCASAGVPFWTVDGSTSVPPNSRLVRKSGSSHGSHSVRTKGDIAFAGAPSKAWRWEKQTESVRKHHVYGVCRDKALDAPELECKLPVNFFLHNPLGEGDAVDSDKKNDKDDYSNFESNAWLKDILGLIPSKWKNPETPAPGQRPWSVEELRNVSDCKAWSMAWKGADSSVPPCQQTHGSRTAAKHRWRSFVKTGLKDYAKKRNSIVQPHAVSRISCYLNLGILSIFDVLNDVWEAKSNRGFANGCNKFLEEVVKWREGSYVHAFANPDYHTAVVLPAWACKHLESIRTSVGTRSETRGYTYQELEGASTRDETWNAMQDYLIDTGELHNNARMTWGKTVVHWQASRVSPEESLWQLCCLNDRYALDGLSHPSYGGVLWCFGWQDKPAQGFRVSEKWAHNYRTGPSGFLQAKERLLDYRQFASTNLFSSSINEKEKRRNDGDDALMSSPTMKKPRLENAKTAISSDTKSILSYFSPTVSNTAKQTIG